MKRQPRSVVVVGSGPAGLFCALRLIAGGIAPVLVERGGTVEERTAKNAAFFAGGALDTDCNVQFGEGGAGTFSDGKLNTQTKDPRNREVLDTFVRFGAPAEIAYLNKPHIGSDKLRGVLLAMREHILQNGGRILFNTRFEGFAASGGEVRGVRLRDLKKGELYELPASEVVLAIGHSSRDTFAMLAESGFAMERAPSPSAHASNTCRSASRMRSTARQPLFFRLQTTSSWCGSESGRRSPSACARAAWSSPRQARRAASSRTA